MKLSHRGRARRERKLASRRELKALGLAHRGMLCKVEPVESVHNLLANGHDLRIVKDGKQFDLVVAKDKQVVRKIDSFPLQKDAVTYGENFFHQKPRRLLVAA